MPVEMGQVTSLADVLLQDHFEFLIPNVPGGADGQILSVLNMSAILPGRANNQVQIELHRHKANFAGKRTFGHTFNATYVDTKERAVIGGFHNWQNMQTDQATGLPRPSTDYKTTGIVRLYGADNQIVEERQFFGLFVNSVNEVALSGSSNSAIAWSIGFTYDYWLPLGVS